MVYEWCIGGGGVTREARVAISPSWLQTTISKAVELLLLLVNYGYKNNKLEYEGS